MTIVNRKIIAASLMSTILLISGCSSDDGITITPPTPDTRTDYQFELVVTNLTHAQPFSPVAFASHNDERLWTIGTSASNALEMLAESGDNSGILADSSLLDTIGGTGVILPGQSETIVLDSKQQSVAALSVVTMLVNTNDAFTGKTGIDVSEMQIGDSISMNTMAYDAGTEGNSEAAGTIPGPADGGEGLNQARDDVDFVALHPGVVGSEDGYMSSVLTSVHKFDNPVMKITITRLR